jgi:hypothetical protein
VEQILDVLGVVEGGVGSGSPGGLLLVPGLTGINSYSSRIWLGSQSIQDLKMNDLTLENAKATEIGQRNLKFPHGLGTGDIVFGLARGTC